MFWFCLVFSNQVNSLMFWVFSVVLLCFFNGFSGVQRGHKSLVFWVVDDTYPKIGASQKGGFPKGWFWRMFPRTKTGTRVHSDVPLERKPEQGYVRMFPRNENQNEARSPKPPFFETALLSAGDKNLSRLFSPKGYFSFLRIFEITSKIEPVKKGNMAIFRAICLDFRVYEFVLGNEAEKKSHKHFRKIWASGPLQKAGPQTRQTGKIPSLQTREDAKRPKPWSKGESITDMDLKLARTELAGSGPIPKNQI